MFATLTQKIELRFWDIILPLLTRSQMIRKAVRGIVSFYHNVQLVRKVAFISMIACAGFASGILFFTISTLIG